MKFNEDEWLTDYVNSLHFTVRMMESQDAGEDVTDAWKEERDALIQDAILCNIPMEVFSIRRLISRNRATDDASVSEDARNLISDYRFLCNGFAEFTLEEVVEECSPYLEKIYPDTEDMAAIITAIFNSDIDLGLIEEIRPGVYQHAPGAIRPLLS